IATLTAPPESKHTVMGSGSAEPFVAGGKSYVVLAIRSEKVGAGKVIDAEIWVLGIEDDPKKRFARRCDNGETSVFRTDPEIYIGKEEVFVYYNVVTKDGVYEVWRSRTGIATK
ncbi:MAG: hypothetical protein HZA91_11620, partial [Verrucomicrobia bacterium]|nr:hypothetical protein [Verrucomicrobiota bacterium]